MSDSSTSSEGTLPLYLEDVIDAVREEPMLWLESHIEKDNYSLRRYKLNEIAVQLFSSRKKVEKVWRSLYNRYRSERRLPGFPKNEVMAAMNFLEENYKETDPTNVHWTERPVTPRGLNTQYAYQQKGMLTSANVNHFSTLVLAILLPVLVIFFLNAFFNFNGNHTVFVVVCQHHCSEGCQHHCSEGCQHHCSEGCQQERGLVQHQPMVCQVLNQNLVGYDRHPFANLGKKLLVQAQMVARSIVSPPHQFLKGYFHRNHTKI